MSKILKNNSGSDVTISDTGVTIDDATQYTIPELDYLLWAESGDVDTEINAGNLVVNDGNNDLSASDGVNFIKYPDTALGVRFLSNPDRTNGFSSKDVQLAIEESRISGIGTVKPYPFVTIGNTSNRWLGSYVPSTFSNQVPLLIPQDADLKGVLFINNDDDVDIDIEVYKNGILLCTEEIRNKRYYYNVGINGDSFNQGDRVSVYLKKYTGGTGDTTAQDPIVTLLVKFTNEQQATGGAQNGL